jgi:amino acid adenylation domain-containing protein
MRGGPQGRPVTDHLALDGPVVPVGAPSGLPGLIRLRYQETAERIVCADPVGELTGRELELASDAMADRISATVPMPGPILLRLRRCVQISVAMLGALKAGCSYLPVDPQEPTARLAAMIRRAGPVAVITDATDDAFGLPVLELPRGPWRHGEPAPLAAVAGDQPVYVMFTSGSTGEPKGVVLGSDALCSRLLWMQRCYPLTSEDRVLQKTPYTFDPSCWEIFWPLLSGARCVYAADGAYRDPGGFGRFMAERSITVCHFVPSMLEQFLRLAPARPASPLRHVFCSGEALSAPLARAVLDRWPGVSLHNLYGPTEAAIDVTYWDVPADLAQADQVPIGHPVDNTMLRVVDPGGDPVQPGTPGELWIGGVQLALGYAGRPDLTARAFTTVAGQRWYHTGDLVRQTADGLAYLGRLDDQVKIAGVRVEPLEVERVLERLTAPAAVVAVPDPAGASLVAVLPADAVVSDAEVLRYVGAQLPSAFQPAAVHRVDTFPLTPNGKLDRGRLAEQVRRWWENRRGQTTDPDLLCAAWRRALIIEGPVDEAQGFVSAGGTSLGAIRLASAVQAATGVEVSLGEIVNGNLSLSDLRARTSAAPARSAAGPVGVPSVPGAPGPRRSLLAPEQRRLWLLGKLYPGSPAYNVTVALRLTGVIDPAALRAALTAAAQRHDILRASVTEDADGTPQLRYQESVHFPLAVTDTDAEVTATVAETFAGDAATIPLSERLAPMARAYLLRSSATKHSCLVLVFNHLVADQQTVDLILTGLAADYVRALAGGPLSATEPAPRYADYAIAAQSSLGSCQWADSIEYWRRRLDNAPPELSMPFRFPATDSWRDLNGAASTRRLGSVLSAHLAAYRRERATTTAAFFLAVFGFVLAAWSGQDTVVIGIPASRRRTEADQDLAGFMLDTLPVRLDLAGQRTFDELRGHAQTRYIEAMEHSGPTFDEVVGALRPPREAGRNPVFQVWLNDLTGAAPPPRLGDVTAEAVLPPVHSALFDLGLYLHAETEGLTLRLVRAVDRYRAEVANELMDQCVMVVTQVLADPGITLGEITLRTPRAAALLARPDTGPAPAGPRVDVAADVAAVAAAAPDSIAIVSSNGELTYRDLWWRAERTAAGLRTAGLGSGDTVVLLSARHPDLPVALLACWLAGTCVALVDAALPAARRRACRAVVGGRVTFALHDVPDEPDALRIGHLLTSCAADGVSRPERAPETGLSHVLFTSGTTGQPVPVGVPHGPLRDFLHWYRQHIELGPADRVALLAGPGHDPVLRDVFAPLTAGARLYVPPPDVLANPSSLPGWLTSCGITLLHTTPALLDLMLSGEVADGGLDCLRWLVVGGAPLMPTLVARVRAVTDATIVNAYGMTETPQIMSCYRVPRTGVPTRDQVPVGVGSGGSHLLVVTAGDRLAGIGQRGEVVVRSRNLAAGYLGPISRPDAFGANPTPGVRTFRTGDLARYDIDGLVVLDGRRDRQVSIAGYRLELGEVEAAALRCPGVRQAVATVSGGDGAGSLTLDVAADVAVSVAELRSFLASLLPAYAVPVSVRVASTLALGVTHKVRPEPDAAAAWPVPGGRGDSGDLVPGQDVLAWIEASVRQVLGRPLGTDENFFDAGLNSMDLLHLHQSSTFGADQTFPVTVLFAHPNLRALGEYLRDGERVPAQSAARPNFPGRRQAGLARQLLRSRIRAERER